MVFDMCLISIIRRENIHSGSFRLRYCSSWPGLPVWCQVLPGACHKLDCGRWEWDDVELMMLLLVVMVVVVVVVVLFLLLFYNLVPLLNKK